MILDLLGWLLAATGLAGLSIGCRRARFADEAAEYLPACVLLQGAALMAWLAGSSLGHALLRCALCSLAALLAYGLLRGVIVLPHSPGRARLPAATLQRGLAAKR